MVVIIRLLKTVVKYPESEKFVVFLNCLVNVLRDVDFCLNSTSLPPVGARDDDLCCCAPFLVVMDGSNRATWDLLGPDRWPADDIVDGSINRIAIG